MPHFIRLGQIRAESFQENGNGSNNTLATANQVYVNGTNYTAQIAQNDEKDFYKFTLGQSGKVNFSATFYNMEHGYWVLFDENGEKLTDSYPHWNSTTKNIVVSEVLHLTSGTYYLGFERDNGSKGKFIFSLSYTSAGETYHETNGGTNNTTTSASALTIGKTYKGQIALNDEKDFYVFTLSSARAVNYQINAEKMEYITVKLYDASGNELWDAHPYWNSTNEKIVWSDNEKLSAGTKTVYGKWSVKMAKRTK